jgi:lipopolysaccharide transport system permease protein
VGQVFGTLWAFGHPLILMGIYVMVFGSVFRTRLGGVSGEPFGFAVYALSGLIPWLCFQESLMKAPTVIVYNAPLVKQIVFPLEVLPAKGVFASYLTQLFSTAVLIGYVLLRYHWIHWTYVLLPVLFLLQAIAMMGISYILSAIGVYMRDTKDFVQVFCTANFFLMPMIYAPEKLPPRFASLLTLNPFSHLIWCYQDVCYFGRMEHPVSWIVFPALSLALFLAGCSVFRKLRPMFGNAL